MFAWFRDQSISLKLLSVFSIMLVGYATGGYFAWDAIQKTENLAELALKARSLRNNMNTARIAVEQIIIRHYAKGYNGDSDDEDKKDILENTEKTYTGIQDLKNSDLKDYPAIKDNLDKLEDDTKAYANTRDTEQLPAVYRGDLEKASQVSVGQNRVRFAEIKVLAYEIADHCRLLAKQCGERATNLLIWLGITQLY